MASVFWYSQGVIMIDHLEQGRMINGAYYGYKGNFLIIPHMHCQSFYYA